MNRLQLFPRVFSLNCGFCFVLKLTTKQYPGGMKPFFPFGEGISKPLLDTGLANETTGRFGPKR